MNLARKLKSIVGGVQSNGFVTHVIIERVDVNVSQKNIVYGVKKLHYRKIVWSVKKCPLNVPLKVSFLIIISLLI